MSTGGCYLGHDRDGYKPGTVMPVMMLVTVMTGRVVTMGHDGSVPTCADVGSGLSENKALHLSQT